MKTTAKTITITALSLLLSLSAFSQTGILPSDAAFRSIPKGAERDSVKLDSLNRYYTERPVAGSHRKGNTPMLFLIGDSTMRTGVEGNGDNGQWGWGYYLPNYFDTNAISIENHALGGESTRSFFKNYLFPVLRAVRPGDYVIIQLGHNDRTNGSEMNDKRFRGLLPGDGKEYTEVILPGNGTRERVYTYGEYLRIYIDEISERGGKPILLSLTARNRRSEETGEILPDSERTELIRKVAEEKGIPFIDFNSAICDKYNNTFDKKKVDYLFYSDNIHTSSFGAVINAETFVELLRQRPEIGLSEFLLPENKKESPARMEGKPVLFIVGDSTGKIDNSEQSGQVGWGQVAAQYFKTDKIGVDNHAKAGRSARTFLDEGRWNEVYDELKPGDYVIIQFGHNDGGPINTGKARGEFRGNDDNKQVMRMEASGLNQGIYSFGWYIRKYCLDVLEKGATPIVLSTTPRNIRDKDGKIERNPDYTAWAKEAAEQTGAWFIDLNEISASALDRMSKEEVDEQFRNDHTHSSLKGANRNARCTAQGIKAQKKLPLRKYVK